VENVIFTVPETQFGIHGIGLQVGGHMAMTFMLEAFLGEMGRTVRRWYDAHKENEEVITRIWNMLSWRPDGLPGFISGAPVIASGPEQPNLMTALQLGGAPH
jgi:hypothetical protein